MEEKKGISRRGFLKTATAVGAALTIQPTIDKVTAANVAFNENALSMKKDGMQYRMLGSGRAVMEVSALGFGVMGMTYNRSRHPDKKACIRLLYEAVERGVTLFDTAIIYGPLTKENLTGEALAEFKGRINVTTKFGHEVIDGKGTGRQDSSRATFAAIARIHSDACGSKPCRCSTSTGQIRALQRRRWRRPSPS